MGQVYPHLLIHIDQIDGYEKNVFIQNHKKNGLKMYLIILK